MQKFKNPIEPNEVSQSLILTMKSTQFKYLTLPHKSHVQFHVKIKCIRNIDLFILKKDLIYMWT